MQNLYSIKDHKIGFTTIFIAPNNAAAIRMFGDTVRDKSSMLGQHPEDYALYGLGTMDDNTGELTSETKFLENAITFATEKK